MKKNKTKSIPTEPTDTALYAVKFKATQSTTHWNAFSRVRLPISVGQEYHEGEKFRATALWCAQRYDSSEIVVTDTLQRHNFSFYKNQNQAAAFDAARRAGDEWIARNRQAIALMPNCRIRRWEDFRAFQEYADVFGQVMHGYGTYSGFRTAVDSVVSMMWARKSRTLTDTSEAVRARFFASSREYILEELAVAALMSKEYPAVELYPGSAHLALAFSRDNLPEGSPDGLRYRHTIRVDFSRRGDKATAQDNTIIPGRAVFPVT